MGKGNNKGYQPSSNYDIHKVVSNYEKVQMFTPKQDPEEKAVETQPSAPVYDVYIPRTSIVEGKFVYNFFTTDESTNPQQNINVNNIPTKNKLQRLPRYNVIQIKNSAVHKNKNEKNVVSFAKSVQQSSNASINTHYDKILTENNFDNVKFTGVSFKDSGLDNKLNNILLNALGTKITMNMYQTGQTDFKQLDPTFSPTDASALDIAKALNNLTSENVDEHFITDFVIPKNSPSPKTAGESGQKNIDYKKLFDKIKDIVVGLQLNNKTIDDVVTNVINDPLTIYSDELLTIKDYAESAQNAIIEAKENTDVELNDYYSLINFVMLKYKLDNELFTSKIIGYVVNKYEQIGGRLQKLDDIIIDNPNTTTFIDHNIKYGSKYLYDIKTIGSITLDSIDIETQQVYDTEIYITSTASDTISIKCTETVPPPHPYDFKITFDYEAQATRLAWAFPPNSQRDVKAFQIFRRPSLDEPFQLIRQYDFNDADVKYSFDTATNSEAIQTMASPKTHYIDYDFNKKTKCIYAICCVDAHGMSSGYSMQLEVSFDAYTNKIVVKFISPYGAPKQYPNIFIDEDIFLDVIKTTNFKKCHIYFEPEFLELYQQTASNTHSDLKLLSTDKNDGKYILQIINTDNQKQQSVSITLNDKRDKQQP